MKIIEKQKNVADNLLAKLELADPFCIVAGGAPRDWYLGKQASDIDVFIHLKEGLTRGVAIEWLDKLGFNDYEFLGREILDDSMYKSNPYLKYVIEGHLEDVRYQVMIMKEPTFKSVIPEFPISMSKIWYKNGRINPEFIFKKGMENKFILKTSELYKDGDKYIDKIRKKFPDYRYFSSEKDLLNYMLSK